MVAMGETETQQIASLMAAIIAFSPYRKALANIEPQIVRIALENRQISAALTRLAAARQQRDVSAAPLKRAELGSDIRLFLEFLEYIHFASPAFLATVGEWPMEGKRG